MLSEWSKPKNKTKMLCKSVISSSHRSKVSNGCTYVWKNGVYFCAATLQSWQSWFAVKINKLPETLHDMTKVKQLLVISKHLQISTVHLKASCGVIFMTNGTTFLRVGPWSVSMHMQNNGHLILLHHGTLWCNGSVSDSRSEGCVFKSRRGQWFLNENRTALTLR